jgi:membrane protease YdiL (CAAX protease family)
VTAVPQRDEVAEAPGASSRDRSKWRAWASVVIAVVIPLCVGGLLMADAWAANAPSALLSDAEYLGALVACLRLVARRPGDRPLLRLPAAAAVTGVAAGAIRCGVWLLILPVQRPGPALAVLAAVAGQVLLVAPAEEIQFRGIVLSRLLESTRPWLAVVVSAALFTALHAYSSALFVLPAVAADAVLFTALRARYRCLGGAVVAHALFNAVTVVLPAAAGVSTGRVAGYVVTVIAVDAVAAMVLIRETKGERRTASADYGCQRRGAGTAAAAPLLSPPGTILDLDGAVPYDGRDAAGAYVVSTADGRHLRVSTTGLYLLRAARDGTPLHEITEQLGAAAGKVLSAAEVQDAYLRLLGQIDRTLAAKARTRTGMWGKVPLIPERMVGWVAGRLSTAFDPAPALVAITLAVSALAAGLLTPARGTIHGTAVLYGYLLFVAMLFAHEFGHAAAAVHAGVRPRRVGFVIYLVWPAFYSDVSASWRVSRRARVVIDLGGVYFQLIATGAAAAGYAATGWRPLWVAVLFSLAGCLANINPFFRFDGYWLLGDALGVDSLHTRGRLALSRLARRGGGGVTEYVLAVYIVLTWGIWTAFAAWIATGAYRRLLSLPVQLHDLISGHDATAGDWWNAALSVAVLVMIAVLVVRAGRMAVAVTGRAVIRFRRETSEVQQP